MKNLNYILIISFILVFSLVLCNAPPVYLVKLSNLKIEYKIKPLGVDIKIPRFSWVLELGERGTSQMAYQIIVSSNLAKLNEDIGDVWNSNKVTSDKSVQIY